VSPDGRWLAYTATDASGSNVFVRPFPNVDRGRWPIASGHSPLWSRDGRELFFVSRGRAMAVPIETASGFRPGAPTVMFDLPPFYSTTFTWQSRQWDLAPDGERFLIMNPGEGTTGERSQAEIIVVLNWYEELKRLVPTR
jgi:hypothetical protein